jgi:excisionase family DNA binding protein
MTDEFNNLVDAIPNEAMILDSLLTPAKAALILGISKKLLHELCRQRKLEYVQIGSRRRFTQEQLQAFIDSQTVKSPGIDKKPQKRLPCPSKGGEKRKSVGLSRNDLRKEIRSLCR